MHFAIRYMTTILIEELRTVLHSDNIVEPFKPGSSHINTVKMLSHTQKTGTWSNLGRAKPSHDTPS